MNKIIVSLMLGLVSVTAFAQHRHNPHYYHHRHGPGPGYWMAPLIIGGVAGYAISRAQTPPAPAVPPVVYVPQGLPPAPVGYHYEQILDANCNCYRWIIAPNS